MNVIEQATSLTHQHIAAIINTKLAGWTGPKVVRILDIGHGDGRLMSHILAVLPILHPDLEFELHGLDVADAGQQLEGFATRAASLLAENHPDVDWSGRLTLCSTSDAWPYEDDSFDFITSNQVMEHVRDHHFVFGQIRRCLRPEGLSVNLFPIRECLWEGHALMPFVHRVRDEKRRARLMLFLAKLGFTKHYHRDMERRGWKSLEEFATVFAHVIETETNYLTARELTEVAEGQGMKISFNFSKNFFLAKLFSYFGRRSYKYRELGVVDSAGFWVGKRLSSVTILLKPS